MPSSPARRRQSTRTPQRRPERSKTGQTDKLDPFVCPQKPDQRPGNADMLRQSLLAQLSARVETEPSTPKTSWQSEFRSGRHATTTNNTTTTDQTYDDKHKKLFSSMASIGSSIARSVWRQTPSSNGGPSKRSVDTVADLTNGTPSKRRRLAEVVNLPTTTNAPALSFHFDDNVSGSSSSGGDHQNEGKLYATPTRIPVPVHTPTQQTQRQDSQTTTTTTPRDVRRKEKKTREVLLRKNNKASAPRPSWR